MSFKAVHPDGLQTPPLALPILAPSCLLLTLSTHCCTWSAQPGLPLQPEHLYNPLAPPPHAALLQTATKPVQDVNGWDVAGAGAAAPPPAEVVMEEKEKEEDQDPDSWDGEALDKMSGSECRRLPLLLAQAAPLAHPLANLLAQ